jgi:hypothetical protein
MQASVAENGVKLDVRWPGTGLGEYKPLDIRDECVTETVSFRFVDLNCLLLICRNEEN